MQLNAPHSTIDLIPKGCIQGFAHSRCLSFCVSQIKWLCGIQEVTHRVE